MKSTQWSSALSDLQEAQKREFQEWVCKVHEDLVKTSSKGVFLRSRISVIEILWTNSACLKKADERFMFPFCTLSLQKRSGGKRFFCFIPVLIFFSDPGGSFERYILIYGTSFIFLFVVDVSQCHVHAVSFWPLTNVTGRGRKNRHLLDPYLWIIRYSFHKSIRS